MILRSLQNVLALSIATGLLGGCNTTDSKAVRRDGLRISNIELPAQAPDNVEAIRARLPALKTGMTEAEVQEVLKGLKLGEPTVVSRTISGGATLRYNLAPGKELELSFVPRDRSEQGVGRLVQAAIVE